MRDDDGNERIGGQGLISWSCTNSLRLHRTIPPFLLPPFTFCLSHILCPHLPLSLSLAFPPFLHFFPSSLSRPLILPFGPLRSSLHFSSPCNSASRIEPTTHLISRNGTRNRHSHTFRHTNRQNRNNSKIKFEIEFWLKMIMGNKLKRFNCPLNSLQFNNI